MGRTPSSNLAEDRRGGDLKQVGKRMLCKAGGDLWTTAKHEVGGGAQGKERKRGNMDAGDSSIIEVVQPEDGNLEEPGGKHQKTAGNCENSDTGGGGCQVNPSRSSASEYKAGGFDSTLGYQGQDQGHSRSKAKIEIRPNIKAERRWCLIKRAQLRQVREESAEIAQLEPSQAW